MAHWILHVDVDQFLVAVEVRRRPELRGRPVVVGGSGDPTQPRMVVASASYEARAFGVHSGMPLRTAARKCPDAVFLPSDRPAYDEASAEVMDTLRQFPVVVEVWGWDEAALGAETDDPEALAADLQRAVVRETGLTCSIGIGDNKVRAKMATGFAKPAGIYRLTEANWIELMGDRPTDALWGVGTKTARKLAELGLVTVRHLASADVAVLRARFGPTMGAWYLLLARGVGSTEVTAEPWVPRSRSRQTTFVTDLNARADIEREIVALAHRVTADVTVEGRWIRRVAIVVRSASFFTRTRITTLARPTQDPDDVASAAVGLLDRVDLRRPVRLLGVRAELVPENDPAQTDSLRDGERRPAMFVQVIQGKVSDPERYQRQTEAWQRDLKPGAVGYLGSTGGVTADGRGITIARFESEDAARANSERPEQGAWWAETAAAYDGEVTFHDCHDVDLLLGGGSNEAGFVQIIQGRAKDQEAMRRMAEEATTQLRDKRPDILGILVAWHGDDGGFTQVVYFESEKAARAQEEATADDELGREFMDSFDGPPTFFDLPEPQLD